MYGPLPSAAGEDTKLVVHGSLDYTSGRAVWNTDASKDRAAFVHLLNRLAEAFLDE